MPHLSKNMGKKDKILGQGHPDEITAVGFFSGSCIIHPKGTRGSHFTVSPVIILMYGRRAEEFRNSIRISKYF